MDLEIEQAQIPTEENNEHEINPKWWQSLLPRFVYFTGFNAFTAALTVFLLIASLALSVWLIALHFKHKAEIAQLELKQPDAAPVINSDEPATPEELQLRLTDAQQQLADLKAQLNSQNADKVLSNQELLGIQNNTLQKEIEDFTKPQLDVPIIDLDPALIRAQSTDPAKPYFTNIEVPPTAALFTLILHKPADKQFTSYWIELFDARKTKPVWAGENKPNTQANITLSILRRNYPSGKYRVALSGLNGKKKEPIDNYNLDVKFQLPPRAKKKK